MALHDRRTLGWHLLRNVLSGLFRLFFRPAAPGSQAHPHPHTQPVPVGRRATGVIHNQYFLLLGMAGVGLAWASVLSMPYAMLAGALPPEKSGVYMGIFSFFIVIPEITASVGFGWVMKRLLGNNRLAAVVAGGVFLAIAALLTQRVRDPAT